MMTLVAGAVLVRWLADHIEPWGLGEGFSLIIFISITTRALPHSGSSMPTLDASTGTLACPCLLDRMPDEPIVSQSTS